jgi:hypothetical protein
VALWTGDELAGRLYRARQGNAKISTTAFIAVFTL